MPWAAGSYTKGNSGTGGWTGDASLGIGIEAGRHDTQDNDFATGINQCINKDGSNAFTADPNLGGFKPTNIAAGTAAAPALCVGGDVNTGVFGPAADTWAVATNGTERVRVDSTGRVGIGTSSPASLVHILNSGDVGVTIESTGGAAFDQSILFKDTTSTWYVGNRYSAPNTSFGIGNTASKDTIVINAAGDTMFGTTNADPPSNNVAGVAVATTGGSTGLLSVSRMGGTPARINRGTDDGNLVEFNQAGALEGAISVSGNTITYGAFSGSHWSQLSNNSRPEILRGTVLETIDELCEWEGEENERLAKVKISDTVASKAVYGVFMDWDNDWSDTNDMRVTSIGAFICRLHTQATPQVGDLLESNGDGTARVQAYDVIKSSTIGKVTCSVKTHEYDDGTFCVPVVLMCG